MTARSRNASPERRPADPLQCERMDAILTSEGLLALVTLTFLEIVLGVDNVIFISILSSGSCRRRSRARRAASGSPPRWSCGFALLLSIAWVIGLTAPFFTVLGQEISGRDLILLGGGLFLLGKATLEIHDGLEGEEGHRTTNVAPSFGAVIVQIMLLDIVFSLDSVITAVGMAEDISIMVPAVVLAVGVMMFSAEPISAFVQPASDGEDAGAVVPAAHRRCRSSATGSECTSRRATSTSRWASRSSSR